MTIVAVEVSSTTLSFTGSPGAILVSEKAEMSHVLTCSPSTPDAPSDGDVYGRKDGRWVESDNFSYENIQDDTTIRLHQQMIVMGGIVVESDLNVEGTLVLEV